MTQEEFFKRYTYSIRTDKIGGGAFGTVYKAYDNILNREVAIKVSEVKIIGDKEFSLKDEFNVIKYLPVHPNIANYDELHTYEMPNGIFDYAIMQFYKDGNLSVALKQDLTNEQKEQIAIDLLQGIIHLHKHKVVHRDLKPCNILVAKRGDKIIPIITDFGLSKQTKQEAQSMFSNSFGGGTLKYSSPEQLKGETLRLNTDLWAYGVIVYEIFTGKHLFNATTATGVSAEAEKEIYEQILNSNFTGQIDQLPAKWQKVISLCLVRNAEKRIKSAKELENVILGNNTFVEPQNTSFSQEDKTKVEASLDYLKTSDEYYKLADKTIIEKPVAKKRPEKIQKHIRSDESKAEQKKKNKLLIPLLSLTAVAIITALFFILSPSEQADWQTAKEQNTITAYEDYLADYPQGEYIAQTKENIAWQTAEQENNTISYLNFTSQYPQSLQLDTANKRIQKLQLDSTLALNNTTALRSYIQQYQQGTYIADANNKLTEMVADSTNNAVLFAEDKAAYDKAKRQGTKKAYQSYLADYLQGQYAKQAKKAIKNISNRPKINYGSFTDKRDGKKYKTIKIGTQTWMAENLNYTGNNGYQRHITSSSEWKFNGEYNGWCYYNNDPKNGGKYGVLYQWEAVKNACPKGWHLPTEAEWDNLVNHLGGRTVAGGKLKTTNTWRSPNKGATNSSGFSAFPSGCRNNGTFESLGLYGAWWLDSQGTNFNAEYGQLYYNSTTVDHYIDDKSRGVYVRCIKD